LVIILILGEFKDFTIKFLLFEGSFVTKIRRFWNPGNISRQGYSNY